jgi:hypothetical protein
MLVRRVDILSVFTLMISSLRFMWEEGWETCGVTDLVGRAFASDFEHFFSFLVLVGGLFVSNIE